MNSLLGFVLISVLLLIVIVQIARVTELAGIKRGEKETQKLKRELEILKRKKDEPMSFKKGGKTRSKKGRFI